MVHLENNDEDNRLEFGKMHKTAASQVDSQGLMSQTIESNANMMTTELPHLRLCVLGAKGVGKTAIIVRYLTRRFIGEYHSQIDVCYSHVLALGNKRINIQISDFSPKNQEEIFVPRDAASTSDCFLVVFSISDRSSFLEAINIASILRSFPQSSSAPLTLLGNKKDLDHSRQVSFKELQNISSLLKCECAEVSVSESREDIVPIIFNIFVKVLGTSAKFRSLAKNITNRTSNFSLNLNHDSECSNENKDINEEEDSEYENTKYTSKLNGPHIENSSQCNGILDLECLTNCLHNENGFKSRLSDSTESSCREELSKRRVASNSPLPRTKSLNFKQKLSKQESQNTKERIHVKSNSFRASLPANNERKLSKDMKYKDSKNNNLLNCSGVSEEPNTNRPISKYKFNSRKEFGSTTNRDNQEANSLNKTMSNANSVKKTPLRSRKHLYSRFTSPDVSLTSNASETPKIGSRSFQTNLKQPNQPNHLSPPVVRPAFGDLSTARSYSKFESPSVNRMNNYTNATSSGAKPKMSENRERKFGVFGKGVLANVLSKTSLPDLPKATFILYAKFDSIKKTIHKRSL